MAEVQSITAYIILTIILAVDRRSIAYPHKNC